MGHYTLVVSNPPQLDVDAEQAAPLLGLTPDQFGSKAAYSVPEIWFAHPDKVRAGEVAEALRGAHCRVAVFDSGEFVGVPPRRRVRSFSFTDTGLVAHADDEEAKVEYSAPLHAVFCRPREVASDRPSGGSARRSSSVFSLKDRIVEASPTGLEEGLEGEDTAPFLDLFLPANGAVRRYTVQQNGVSFAGLGRVQPRAAANMEALVGSCEDRFGAGRVDRRLVGMRLRTRVTRRAPGSEHRRGFSYASPGLLALLAALERGLDHVTQAELSSRLAFLSHHHSA